MDGDIPAIDDAAGREAYSTAPGTPAVVPREPESILVHPGLHGWRLAILAVVVVVPVAVLGLTTAVAVAAMVSWLAAVGMTGLVAIVLAVLNARRSLTLTSSR